MRTTYLLLALMGVVIAALAACSPGPEPEASITVYTALEDDELAVYRDAFEAAHPEIELKIVRDSTGIVTSRLLAEKGNPQADVVWGLALSSLLIADDQGMLAGYAPEGLNRLRTDFRDERHDPPHWVGIKAWMTGVVCNEIEMERLGIEAPRSYADLVKPEYKEMIVMPNPASSGTGYLTVSAILQLKGEEAGWEYLEALDENIAFYTHSGSKPAKLAGTGEFPIGISFGYRGIKQAQTGEPVVTVFPEEGSGWEMEANALVQKSELKPEARTFLDWAISDEVMQLYADVYPVVAVETNQPVPEGYPEKPEQQLIKNDFEWAAQNRERILEEWSRRFDSKTEAQ
jgi:iron(III) transport system substrate-binding protein